MNRTENVKIVLSKDERKVIEAAAALQDRTMSAWLRRLAVAQAKKEIRQ